MTLRNLFCDIPLALPQERFETLLQNGSIRLERIVSMGQASPPGFWYEQDEREWVVLLSGSAGLLFEGDTDVVVLRPGDFIDIPAHRRHRVEWTAARENTVWLALHYHDDADTDD